MRCEQFERRLQEVFDDRSCPELDDSLREHADACGDCRELLGAYDSLLTTVAAGWVPRGSSRLTNRILAEWNQTAGSVLEPAPRSRRLRAWQVVAGSFACAAALGIAILPLLQSSDSSVQPVADAGPTIPSTAPQIVLGRGHLGREQLGAVAHETGRGLAMLVLQFPDYGASAGPDGQIEDHSSWLRPVSSSLKPFSSVGEPFNVLLRATGARGGESHSS